MQHMRNLVSWVTAAVLMFGVSRALGIGVSGEEFVGPFASWANVKTEFGAVGDGKARTAIQHGVAFSTANEFTDLIIKDVVFGIEAGMRDGIAETAILRCRFYRCSKAAVSIQNFNSLDFYLWDCWFEDCGIGVTNEFDAGNFHVYQSVFLRSSDADITIRHTGFFSLLGNVSIGSKAFFRARRAAVWKPTETCGSQATLQDNLILDPQEPTPIQIENNGPNLVVDNTIRAQGDGPVVRNEPPAEKADLICIGNTWSAAKALQMKGRLTDLDNKVVRAGEIKDVNPAPVAFLPRAGRPIIEVAAGADAAAIQAAIDQAAAMKGKRPVVHLPKGSYMIGKTLVIPAGTDLQLVGDGPEDATQLANTGGASPLIRVLGPSHATFRGFLADAGKAAVCIEVANCDQEGARIFGEQLYTFGYEYGLVTDGLKNARVELRDHSHHSIQVNGAGPGTKSWVALFCGSSTRGSTEQAGFPLYDVQQGGRLLVRDIWYEGQAYRMMNLTGSGELAYHSGFMAPFDPNRGTQLAWEQDLRLTVAPLQVDGFRGKVALTLNSVSGGDIRVKPPSPELEFLLLGFHTNRKIDLGGEAVKGQVVAEHLRSLRNDNGGSAAVEGTGRASPAFIREMLKPLREVKPQPLTALQDDVSDMRFYRVTTNGKNGMRLHAAPGQ